MALACYQPRGNLQVDQSQRLAAGLRIALLPGVSRSFDPASMRTVAPNGMKQVPAPTGYAAGFGATLGAATSDKVLTHISGALPTARSYFFRARRNGAGGGSLGRLFDKSSGSSGQFLYFHNASGFLRYGIHIASSETNTDIVSGADITPGQWFDVLVTHLQVGSVATINAYINGNQVVANRVINGTLTDAAATVICVGNRNSDNARVWDGLIAAAYVWDKELTLADAAALSMNPWALFAAPEEEDYVLRAAVQQSISVVRASLLLSGSEVALRVSRRSAVQPAQMQVTGADVALETSRRIGVQPAVLSATGGQVDLWAARRLAVAPVASTLMGGAIELVYTPAQEGNSYSIAVSPAVLVLTGGNVTMRVNRQIPVDAAQLAIGAGPVRMIAARRQLVSPAHLVLAGGDVTLRFSAESPPLDIAKVHSSRVVIFEGSGSKVVVFEGSGSKVVVFEGSGKRMRFNDMSAKVPIKVGEKWITDRDRDEISYYAADITDELADRNTTAIADEVTAPVFGVELLEGPQVQVATVDGIERTYVVVKLGDVDGAIPDDWRWVARVPCANGERFDRTTWFNEVDP